MTKYRFVNNFDWKQNVYLSNSHSIFIVLCLALGCKVIRFAFKLYKKYQEIS